MKRKPLWMVEQIFRSEEKWMTKIRLPSLRDHWALWISLVLFWMALTFILLMALRSTEGQLVYPLDDTYIHLAIAKNLATKSIWSIDGASFSSSSSSLLWVTILSLPFMWLGDNASLSPFIINVFLGTLILVIAYFWLRDSCEKNIHLFTVLGCLIFFTPLPALVFSGMEHVCQIMVFIVFVAIASEALVNNSSKKRIAFYLVAMAPLVTMVRYEGLFATFTVCAFLLWKRRFSLAIAVGLAASLPLTVYGVISIAEGWYFMPNGVILKGVINRVLSIRDLVGWLVSHIDNLYSLREFPGLMLMMLASVVLLMLSTQSGTIWQNKNSVFLIIYLPSLVLHTFFANYDPFLYRYEAYLVAGGIVGIGGGCCLLLKRRNSPSLNYRSPLQCFSAVVLVTILGIPFLWRAGSGLINPPTASRNIFEQQIQMATFLSKFYSGNTVAANDIGAISYLAANTKLIDLEGLASMEVARARLAHEFNTDKIRKIVNSKNTSIAIVYDKWYKKDGKSILPPEWVRVAEWTISDNKVCGSDTVAFYAVGKDTEVDLYHNLTKFKVLLPPKVRIQYLLTQHGSGFTDH